MQYIFDITYINIHMNRKSIIGDSFGRKEICKIWKYCKKNCINCPLILFPYIYYVICTYMKSVLLYGFLERIFQEFCYKCYFHNFFVYLLEEMIICIISDDEISSSGWKSQQTKPGFYDQNFQDGLVTGKATRFLGLPTSPIVIPYGLRMF